MFLFQGELGASRGGEDAGAQASVGAHVSRARGGERGRRPAQPGERRAAPRKTRAAAQSPEVQRGLPGTLEVPSCTCLNTEWKCVWSQKGTIRGQPRSRPSVTVSGSQSLCEDQTGPVNPTATPVTVSLGHRPAGGVLCVKEPKKMEYSICSQRTLQTRPVVMLPVHKVLRSEQGGGCCPGFS